MNVRDAPRKSNFSTSKRFPVRPRVAALFVERRNNPRKSRHPIEVGHAERELCNKSLSFISGIGRDPHVPSHSDYGLMNWRRYAIVKHGNDPRFLNSAVGSDIVARVFAHDVQCDLVKITDWVEAVEVACVDLEREVAQARADASHAQQKIAHLEGILKLWEDADSSGSEPSVVLSRRVLALETELDGALAEIHRLQEEATSEKHDELYEESIAQIREEIRYLRETHSAELEAVTVAADGDLAASRARESTLREQLEHAQTQLKAAEHISDDLKKEQKARRSSVGEVERLRREVSELLQKIDSVRSDGQKKISHLQASNKSLQSELEHLAKEAEVREAALANRVIEVERQRDELVKDGREREERSRAAHQIEINALRDEIAQLKTDLYSTSNPGLTILEPPSSQESDLCVASLRRELLESEAQREQLLRSNSGVSVAVEELEALRSGSARSETELTKLRAELDGALRALENERELSAAQRSDDASAVKNLKAQLDVAAMQSDARYRSLMEDSDACVASLRRELLESEAQREQLLRSNSGVSVAVEELEALRSGSARSEAELTKLRAELDGVLRALENERELSAAQRSDDASAVKNLKAQLDTVKSALENKRARERNEQDLRCASLLEQIHEVERQRNDLLSEKQAWRTEKEAMIEHLMSQIDVAHRERDAYKNECIRLSAELSDLDSKPSQRDLSDERGIVRAKSSQTLGVSGKFSKDDISESNTKPSMFNSLSASSDRFMGAIKKMAAPKLNLSVSYVRSELDSSSSSRTSAEGSGVPQLATVTESLVNKAPLDNSSSKPCGSEAAPGLQDPGVHNSTSTIQNISSSECNAALVLDANNEGIVRTPPRVAASPSNSDEEDDAIAAALSKALDLVQEVRRSDVPANTPKSKKGR